MPNKEDEPQTALELVEPDSPIVQTPTTTVMPSQMNVEVLQNFLSMAKEEIEVRKQETTLRGKEIDNAHEYSMEALKLQAKDLQDGRGFTKATRRDYLYGASAVFVLIVVFLIYCLQTGHEEIAMKIITYGGTALGAGISGYFYGKTKAENKNSEDQPE
jgi:hypothetical protein